MKPIHNSQRLFLAGAIGIAFAGCSQKPAPVGAAQASATPAGIEASTGMAVQPVYPAREIVPQGEEGDVAGGGRVRSSDLLLSAERSLVDVYFSFDDSGIAIDQMSTLEKNAGLLRARPGVTVTIEGYCDERGTGKYNMTLGQHRAETAKARLVALGVEPGRIQTISYGKERPDPAGHDEAAWRLNRRAHFVVTPKDVEGAAAVAATRPTGSR